MDTGKALNKTNSTLDIAVIGGGIVGSTFARLMQKHCPKIKLKLFDRGAITHDNNKSIVIGAPTAKILQQLSALPKESKPIERVAISFSKKLNTLSNEHILGYGICHKTTLEQLQQTLEICQDMILDIQSDANGVCLTFEKSVQHARLVVLSCPFPHLPQPFKTKTLDYQQTILSLRVQVDNADNHTAYEHIGSQGVFTLVPRPDGEYGVIVCGRTSEMGRINALSDSEFSHFLSQQFRKKITVKSTRAAFAPVLKQTTPLAANRLFLIGQGAGELHPIGAQALALGIGDANALATMIQQQFKENTHFRSIEEAIYNRMRTNVHHQKSLLTSTLALTGSFHCLPIRMSGQILFSLLKASGLQKTFLAQLSKN